MRVPKTMKYDDVVLIGVRHGWNTTITGMPVGKRGGVGAKVANTVDVIHVAKVYHRPLTGIGKNIHGQESVYLSGGSAACGANSGSHSPEGYLIKRVVAEKFTTPCKKCYR